MKKRRYQSKLINMIIIIKMSFSSYRFFNIFNNFIKSFRRDTIFMKIYILINLINYISKLYKVDKQILFYSLFDLFYKLSSKKIRLISRIDL